MLNWINAHGLLCLVLAALYSAAISTLPTADEIKAARPTTDPLTLLVYAKVYQFLHLAAFNIAKVVPQLRMLGESGEKKD
jgi:hypothetical protein